MTSLGYFLGSLDVLRRHSPLPPLDLPPDGRQIIRELESIIAHRHDLLTFGAL
jgi:hypothetical protein